MSATALARSAIDSIDVSAAPSIDATSRPVSSIGNRPLGMAMKLTTEKYKVAPVATSISSRTLSTASSVTR